MPSQPSGEPPRLNDDTVADRLNRLFEAFPDPETKQPYTNAKAARLITEMGTPIHENTIAGARRGTTEPSLRHARGIADLFPQAKPDYLMPGTRADKKAIAAQRAEERDLPEEAEAGLDDLDTPTAEDLRALARLFKAPEEVLTRDTEFGKQFDEELQKFLAMRDAQVQAFALRLRRESDENVKREMLAQLRRAGRVGRELARRRGEQDGDGDS
jgi:hypothetical protein